MCGKMMTSIQATERLADGLRRALRGFAATVSVISSESDGERYAMIATAVMPVAMAPPALVVGVNRSASIHPAICNSGALCINVLCEEHELISRYFSSASRDDRFSVGSWR